MADWTRATDLRTQANRLWQRGMILRAVLEDGAATAHELAQGPATGTPAFPHRLTLKAPRPAELSPRFVDVRAWVREIEATPHIRLERRTSRHRELGTNTLPCEAWLDTPDAAASLAGRRKELMGFREAVVAIDAHDVRLLAWVQRYPQRALDLGEALSPLLQTHSALIDASGNGRYLRELDVPGVDTKFIEGHRDTLGAWLDLTLDPRAIDHTRTGVRGFARRYGFKDRPERLRLRSLDARLPLVRLDPGSAELAAADITLDLPSVAALVPAHRHVLIVENEINYLSLPELPATLALFGAGYGTGSLAGVPWLAHRHVHYWGDLDTHGFAILDELRARLPHARSVLMDRRTLLENRALWTKEPAPARRELPRLDDEERTLYEEFVENVHGEALRLEQERLPFGAVVSALRERIGSG